MTAERILQSDVLDILFEDRNKMYGAYELRRTYPRRIKRAIGGMFFIVAVASASYLFGSGRNANQNIKAEYIDSIVIAKLIEPDKPKEPEQPKPKQTVQENVATVKNTPPIIEPDEIVEKTEVPPVTQVDTSAVGTQNIAGNAVADGQQNVSRDEGVEGGKGESEKPIAPEPVMPSGPMDMHMADEMPVYPGGTQALVRYMVNNLTSELEPGNKYVLKAQFVIDEEGKVSDATILSSDDASLNQQVLKTLRKMKQWKPGKYHGKAVAVRFTMPVTFMGPEE